MTGSMQNYQHPLAFCSTHGFFPATAFAFGPHAGVTLTGCSTDCPQCGSISEILPGQYQSTADRLNLLLDKSISPAALRALQDIAERARDKKITAEEAVKEAEKISPGIGSRLFGIADWSDQAKATLYAAIIGAVAAVYAAKTISSGSAPTLNIQPVIERVVERPLVQPAPIMRELEEHMRKRRLERPQEDRSKKNRKRR